MSYINYIYIYISKKNFNENEQLCEKKKKAPSSQNN